MSEHADDIEQQEVNAAIKQPVEHTLYTKLQKMADKMAATRLGQYFMEKGDRLLRTVEYTARWSLPKENQEQPKLRPLSWLPFLALIIVLRLVRFWLSLAALMIGNNPVTPKHVVYFLQTRRRKLRAIRMQGLKVIREHELAQTINNCNGVMHKLYKLLLLPMCCSKSMCNNESDYNLKMLRERWAKAGAEHSLQRQSSQKRSSSKEAELDMATEEEVNQQLSFNELLAKYADMSSDEDSTFEPPTAEESSTDSDCESSEATETEEDVKVIDLEHATQADTNQHMPKPIKMEINSDTESTQNTRMNGNGETSERLQKKLNAMDERKSTPGHISAAATKIPQSAMLSNTAAAGSPTEFNSMLEPFSYNSAIATTENKELPKEVQENIENIEPANNLTVTTKMTANQAQEKQQTSQIKSNIHQTHAQPTQKQNHNHHSSANNRFRGRYRRKFDAM